MSLPSIILTRVSSLALSKLVHELGLGNLGRTVDGDNEVLWVRNNLHTKALDGKRVIAEFHLSTTEEGYSVEVIIHDCFLLIRPERLSDFNPSQYGILPNNERDWLGDKVRPDLRANIDVPKRDVRTGPARPMGQLQKGHRVKVTRAVT